MTTNALMELADRLIQAADAERMEGAIFRSDSMGRQEHMKRSDLLREAATQLRAAASEGEGDRLLRALERAGSAESALRRLVDECDNDRTPGWEDRMRVCIAEANGVLSGHTHPNHEVARDAGVVELLEGCRNILNTLRTGSGTNGTKVYSCIESRGGSLVNVEGTIKDLEAAISGGAGERKGVPGYGGVPIAFDDPELQQW